MSPFSWYFAYGSNMQTATLRGRRGIEFLRALPGRAAGWRIVFDKPALFAVGHSYANIVPDPDAEVFGVLFEVAEADLEHIELTEGVLIDNYRRVTIAVEPLGAPGRGPVSAHSLSSDRRESALRPSIRYMQLLIEGALEHGLPEEYVTWLRAVSAEKENERAAEFHSMIDPFMRRKEKE